LLPPRAAKALFFQNIGLLIIFFDQNHGKTEAEITNKQSAAVLEQLPKAPAATRAIPKQEGWQFLDSHDHKYRYRPYIRFCSLSATKLNEGHPCFWHQNY